MANYEVPLRYLKRQFLQLARMNTELNPKNLTLKQISIWEENLFTQLALIDKIREIEYDLELSAADDEEEEDNRSQHRFSKFRKRR